MKRPIVSAILVLATLFGLLTTWSSGRSPADFARALGFGVDNAGGYNEIHAQYAGFFLAVSGCCAASLAGILRREVPLVLLIVLFGGLALGRFASVLIHGGMRGYGPTIVALHVIDVIGLAIAVTGFALNRAAEPS